MNEERVRGGFKTHGNRGPIHHVSISAGVLGLAGIFIVLTVASPLGSATHTHPDGIIDYDGDNRFAVTDTSSKPWSAVVGLFGNGLCSGAIVESHFVLTAAHCVYDSDGNRVPVDEFAIVPGMDRDYGGAVGFLDDGTLPSGAVYANSPYGFAKAIDLWVHPDWDSGTKAAGEDLAILSLDRNVGDYTGSMTLTTADESHSIYSSDMWTGGYPSDKLYDSSDEKQLYVTENKGCGVPWYDGEIIKHNLDTHVGQSGSPLFVGDSNPAVLAVVSGQLFWGDDDECDNTGARITSDVMDWMVDYMNSQPRPRDRANLVERIGDDVTADWNMEQPGSGVNPERTGPSLEMDIWTRVRNAGTEASGSFSTKFVLSGDKEVGDGDDVDLGLVPSSSLAPFTDRTVTWRGSVPQSIEDGAYWAGWHIDARNEVGEFDDAWIENQHIYHATQVEVDNTPPFGPTPNDDIEGWSNDPTPTFTWDPVSDNADDGMFDSGIDHYNWHVDHDGDKEISCNENADGQCEYTIPNYGNGEHTFYLEAVDGVGNEGKYGSHTFKIDTLPPDVDILCNGDPCDGEWTNNDVLVSLDSSDDHSRVDACEYSVNNGPWQPYDGPFYVQEDLDGHEGDNVVEARCDDNAGNTGDDLVHVRIDQTDPETHHDLSGEQGQDGWYRSSVTVSFDDCEDSHPQGYETSGCDTVHHKVDDGAWETGWSVTVGGDGPHTVRYYGEDVAGNVEDETHEATFEIDTATPKLWVNLTPEEPDGNNSWYTQTVDGTAECEDRPRDDPDARSGVRDNHPQYRIDGGDWNEPGPTEEKEVSFTIEEGNRSVDVRCWDLAGNKNDWADRIKVDQVDPTAEVTLDGEQGNENWYRSNVTATVGCTDAESGCDRREYNLDGAGWQRGDTVEVTGEGDHDVCVRVHDKAGRTSEEICKEFQIDRKAPDLDISLDPSEPNGENGWYVTDVEVTIECEDDPSGVDEINYTHDSDEDETYRTPFTVREDGSHEIEAWCTDDAGNQAHDVAEFKIDQTDPFAEVEAPPVVDSPYNVTWFARDNTSTLHGTGAVENLSAEADWSPTCEESVDGTYETGRCRQDPKPGWRCYQLQIQDKAGNLVNSTERCTVRSEAPVLETTHNEDRSTTYYVDQDGDGQPDDEEEVLTLPSIPPSPHAEGETNESQHICNDRNRDTECSEEETLFETDRPPRPRYEQDGRDHVIYDDADDDGEPDEGEEIVRITEPVANPEISSNEDNSYTIYNDEDDDGEMDEGEEIATTPPVDIPDDVSVDPDDDVSAQINPSDPHTDARLDPQPGTTGPYDVTVAGRPIITICPTDQLVRCPWVELNAEAAVDWSVTVTVEVGEERVHETVAIDLDTGELDPGP